MSDMVSIGITWLHFLSRKHTDIVIVLFPHPNVLNEGPVKKSLPRSLAEICIY